MDFLTTKYVKEQAALGTLPALKCSLKHHEQGRDAKKVELINAVRSEEFSVRAEWCACCLLGEDESNCPLNADGCRKHCCGDLWSKASHAFSEFQADYSNANFKAFQEAEKALCTYIEGKIVKEEAKMKRSPCMDCEHADPLKSKKVDLKTLDKPELRYGDYGNKFTPWVYLHDKLYWLPRGNDKDGFTPDHADFIEHILGNLVDDLAAISEPLEEFTRKDLAGNDFNSFGFTANNETIDYHGEKYVSLGMDEIKVLILNLRRMEATLKSK